jgi:hypothetical protein
MNYNTPELVVLGPASVLVLGSRIDGKFDSETSVTRPAVGLTLGLDD